jgi:cell division protein ZapE
MASSITARYAASVAEGKVERDAAQLALVDALAQLEARIVEHRLARKSSSLGWLFAAGRSKERRRSRASTSTATLGAARRC